MFTKKISAKHPVPAYVLYTVYDSDIDDDTRKRTHATDTGLLIVEEKQREGAAARL